MTGPQSLPLWKGYGKFWTEVKGINGELGLIIIFYLVFCREKKNSCTMVGLKEFVLLDQWLECWNAICKHKLLVSSFLFPSNQSNYYKDQVVFISGLGLGVYSWICQWYAKNFWELEYWSAHSVIWGFSKRTGSVEHISHETLLWLAHGITLFWKF